MISSCGKNSCSFEPSYLQTNSTTPRNHAIAINPIDWKQAAWGFQIQSWPKVLGNDIAGEVYEVGSKVNKFKKGDRVAGLAQGFIKGTPDEGGFCLYTKLPATTAAIVPSSVPFKDAALLGIAISTASYGLQYLGQPFGRFDVKPSGKVLVVYGGSSAVGCMTAQLASAAGTRIISVSGLKNFDLCRQCGASDVFDYKNTNMVDDVVKAVRKDTFVGIVNSISTEDSFKPTLTILEKLGGGKMATSLPPPQSLPDNVEAVMMYGEGDHSAPLWDYFVTKGLESGKLKCLPKPFVVGKGLESLQEAIDKLKAGVSGQKIVVEL